MIDLLYAGGPFAMIPLTILAVTVLVLAIRQAIVLYGSFDQSPARLKRGLNTIIQLGGFSFFYGILTQAIGLYQAMMAIEAVGQVSPAMLAGGLKVSMIAPIFGLIILLVAAICWFVLHQRYETLTTAVSA